MQLSDKDIFEWDVVNWSQSRKLWDPIIRMDQINSGLGIGERGGGLSAYMASNSCEVVCTDLNDFPESTQQLHQSLQLSGKITYQQESVLDLSFDDHTFDVVMFKSVIGALSEKNKQELAIKEMYRVLKPGGYLLFAENLQGSAMHRFFRKKFVKWNHYWRYLDLRNDQDLFVDFSQTKFKSYGFLGAFGRSEGQRRFLGKADRVVQRCVSSSMRYILVGVCRK